MISIFKIFIVEQRAICQFTFGITLVLFLMVPPICRSETSGKDQLNPTESCSPSKMGIGVGMVLGWDSYAITRVIATAKHVDSKWQLKSGPDHLCGSSESLLKIVPPQTVTVSRQGSLGLNTATAYHWEETHSYHGAWSEIKLQEKEPLETIVIANVDGSRWTPATGPMHSVKEVNRKVSVALLEQLQASAKATQWEWYDGGEEGLQLRFVNLHQGDQFEWYPLAKMPNSGVTVLRSTATYEIIGDNYPRERTPPFEKSLHEFIAIGFTNMRGEFQKDVIVTQSTGPQRLLGVYTNGDIFYVLVGESWQGKLILLDSLFNVLGVEAYDFW